MRGGVAVIRHNMRLDQCTPDSTIGGTAIARHSSLALACYSSCLWPLHDARYDGTRLSARRGFV
jgi:hypothetical protein